MPAGTLSPSALATLQKRREEAKKIEPVRNSMLPTGSPMFYYCKLCGLLAEVLPEDHILAPSRHCGVCKDMMADSNMTADDVNQQAGVFDG